MDAYNNYIILLHVASPSNIFLSLPQLAVVDHLLQSMVVLRSTGVQRRGQRSSSTVMKATLLMSGTHHNVRTQNGLQTHSFSTVVLLLVGICMLICGFFFCIYCYCSTSDPSTSAGVWEPDPNTLNCTDPKNLECNLSGIMLCYILYISIMTYSVLSHCSNTVLYATPFIMTYNWS